MASILKTTSIVCYEQFLRMRMFGIKYRAAIAILAERTRYR